MKYLFINMMAGMASTGRIAADQCRELQRQGHECVIAYGREEARCPDVQCWRIGTELDVRAHALRSRLLDDVGAGSRLPTKRFLRQVEAYDPDVIWLHNIHGYYINLELLFGYLKRCGKEIHWTLHDCWAFTGHCAHFDFAGCDRWKTGCHHCPEKGSYPKSIFLDHSAGNYAWKKELFTGIPNMTLRVPSNWLKGRVEQSFLGEYPVEMVYNTVDRGVFKPTPSDFRTRYRLEGRIVILGVASVWNERKGLQDILALEKMLGEEYRVVLIGLSRKQIARLPETILGIPRTNSVLELAQAYTAADVFVNPSYEETFGMTTLEAVCCGTQAIVYRGTACEEIVDVFGGIAVEKGPEHLLEAIQQFTKEKRK